MQTDQTDNEAIVSIQPKGERIVELLNKNKQKIELLLILILAIGIIFGGWKIYQRERTISKVDRKTGPAITPLPTSTPTLLEPTKTSLLTLVPTKPVFSPTPKTTTKVPTPTSTYVAPTPINTPTPEPTVQQSSSNNLRCEVITNPVGGPAPLTVSLAYSAINMGNNYVTGVQWDFEGDGNWDTDMSINNGQVSHTYSAVGIYNIKMRVQISDGQTSDTCSSSIAVQPH